MQFYQTKFKLLQFSCFWVYLLFRKLLTRTQRKSPVKSYSICIFVWYIGVKRLVPCNEEIRFKKIYFIINFHNFPLRWRHNDHHSVSNHQPRGCLLNHLFRRRSKKTSKLRVTGLCVGNSPGPVNSPHKGPVTRKMFPFDDVIMQIQVVKFTFLSKDHTCEKTPFSSLW